MLLAALGLRHVKFRIWERGRQHFPSGEPQEEALGAFPTGLHLEQDFCSRFSLIANFHCSSYISFDNQGCCHLFTRMGTKRQQSRGQGGNKLASLQLAAPFSSLENSEWP